MIEYDKVKGGYRLRDPFTAQTDIIPSSKIEREYYTLSKRGTLNAKEGFLWDGATGAFDTPKIMLASCKHDIFCELYNEGAITKHQRKQADKQFKADLKAAGMWKFRIKYLYQAIRKFLELKEKLKFW